MADRLREHDVTLQGPRLTLRPMTEGDWDTLLRWNQDPEVLYFADADEHDTHTLEEVQEIYRWVSQTACNFVMEWQGRPIGEGWLQRMNLPRLITRHPGEDLRRIDLMIGEKALWGQGLGSEAIGLLTRFGFEEQGCDRVFGCGVADYNPRSVGAFRKCGYRVSQVAAMPPGGKMRYSYDLSLTRDGFLGRPALPRVLNTVTALADPQAWGALAARIELVHAPADEQVVAQLLPDFAVCLLAEGLALNEDLAARAPGLKRIIGPEAPDAMLRRLSGYLEEDL